MVITRWFEGVLWYTVGQIIVIYGVAELVVRVLFVDSDSAKHNGHSIMKNQPLPINISLKAVGV